MGRKGKFRKVDRRDSSGVERGDSIRGRGGSGGSYCQQQPVPHRICLFVCLFVSSQVQGAAAEIPQIPRRLEEDIRQQRESCPRKDYGMCGIEMIGKTIIMDFTLFVCHRYYHCCHCYYHDYYMANQLLSLSTDAQLANSS